MPPRRKFGKGRRKAGVRRKYPMGRRLRQVVNPRPVFTETCRLVLPGGADYTLIPNSGGHMSVNMGLLPQLAQYTALYQKYRILKTTFICLARVNSESADENAAFYNLASAVANVGMARLVFAINDSPNLQVPVDEDAVLTDNGCKIVSGKPLIKIACKPVPDTVDANGVRLTQRGKFINFNTGGPEITHYGVSWWNSQPTTATSPLVGYYVYAKITFQLADPR